MQIKPAIFKNVNWSYTLLIYNTIFKDLKMLAEDPPLDCTFLLYKSANDFKINPNPWIFRKFENFSEICRI